MKITNYFSLILTTLLFLGCSDDNNPEPNLPSNESKNFLIETTVYNPDGASGSSFVQLIPTLSGTIDNANAIQLDLGVSLSIIENEFYSFPSFGSNATDEIRKYNRTSNSFSFEASIATPPFSNPTNIIPVNSTKAYVPLYSSDKIWIINPKTMIKTGEIDISSYAYIDNSPNPACGLIRNGKYYLALNQINPQWLPYEDYRQVDVLVIDSNTDEVIEMVSETSSQLSFPTRPINNNMIFTDEQDNIHIACVGYFGLDAKYPETGFVCIPAGQNQFDPSLSWDISNTPIEGSNYFASSILSTYHIGNGKVAAFVTISELIGDNPYTAKCNMPVIIDLNLKTIKYISDIPISGGHGCFVGKFNNLLVFGSDGSESTGFFTYNPSTEAVELALSTTGAPYFMHAFD